MSRAPQIRAGFEGEKVVVTAALRDRFLIHVRMADGDACWEWTGSRARRGSVYSYGIFCALGKRGRRILAHRLAWLIANGPIPPGLVVRHRCDNVICVRVSHLEIGTQADNLRQWRERGRAHFNRFTTGAGHPNAKMDAERVRTIRARRSAGVALAKIAAEFGLNASTVHDIVRRRTWGHVA